MAGVRGIGGVPEPRPEASAEIRGRKSEEVVKPASRDGVEISLSAQQAVEVSRLLDMTREQPDIRTDRVAAAKERLARGEYKREDVVRQVAGRLSDLVSE